MFNLKKHAQNELADINGVIDKADDSLDSQGTPVRTNPSSPEEILKNLTPEQREIAKNNLISQSWLRIQDSIKKMPNGFKVIGYLNGLPEYKDLATRYKNLTLNQNSNVFVDGKKIDELANIGFSTSLTNNLQAQEAAILSRARSIEKKLIEQENQRKQKQLQQFSVAAFNLEKVKTAQIQPYVEDLDGKVIFIKKYLPLLMSNDINKFNTARNEILNSVGLGTAMADEVRTQLEAVQQLSPERIQEAEEILGNIYTNWMSPNSKGTQEGLVMSENKPKGIIKHDLSDRVLNNKPLSKEAAANIGAESLLYGPTEKRICPKLRGKGGGVPGSNDVVSEYICRHHCLDGIVIDDNKTVCGEALWRANVMDKFSRDYVNEEGEIVGGYLNKRFEINRNVPEENKMRLKPGEIRKPRPPELGNLEARMQAIREKEGEKRGYRPNTDKSEPFNWCKDVDQNNVSVSQSERNKREENSGHDLINVTEKKAFNIQPSATNSFNFSSLKQAGPVEEMKEMKELKELHTELNELSGNPIDSNESEIATLQNISNKIPQQVAAFNLSQIKTAQGDNIPGTDNGRSFNPIESPIRDEESVHDFAQCPICDGEGQSLGVLGRSKYYKCRQCGGQFSNSAANNNNATKIASLQDPKKKRSVTT